ncbi:MAG: VWA domain-containing protein [Chloroflexi bacterium]|nr:VWA domain-containing protein [Chloroflexota bacterium]
MIFRDPQVLVLLPVTILFMLFIGRRRNWSVSAGLLRLGISTLILLALADPIFRPAAPGQPIIFVVDQSASLSANGQISLRTLTSQAQELLLSTRQTPKNMPVILFGSQAMPVEGNTLLSPGGKNLSGDVNQVGPMATNIGAALQLAHHLLMGAWPPASPPSSGDPPRGKIVLFSDGQENTGNAAAVAAQLAADGIAVDVWPFQTVNSGPEIWIDRINIPVTLRQGEEFDAVLSVYRRPGQPATPTKGILHLEERRGEALAGSSPPPAQEIAAQTVDLRDGLNTFTLRLRAGPPGFIAYRAWIEVTIDTIKENNAAATVATIYPIPHILMIHDSPGSTALDPQASRLRTALDAAGIQIDWRRPQELPSRLSELSSYDALVLLNVSATDLSIDQTTTIQEYVRSEGHGLVVIGGRSSYTLGEYKNTPLEATLPVKMEPPPREERPPVSLLIILDHSASMGIDRGVTKLTMAKEAAILATEILGQDDRIGVMIFDTDNDWIVPLQQVGNGAGLRQIQDEIASISMGGGTDIYKALEEGIGQMSTGQTGSGAAAVKHIILLSDGQSSSGTEATFRKLVEEARGAQITLSTIAIGDDADQALLRQIADWGKGRYHFVKSAQDIPKVTVQESAIVRSQAVQEGNFHAQLVAPHPTLRGFVPQNLPPIKGYIATTPKPEAEIVLRAGEGDPLLATWQYGLGRVVAWLSDAGETWATDWPVWSEYSHFWAQLARYTIRDPASGPVQVKAEINPVAGPEGHETTITVESLGEDGRTIDLARTTATLIGPGGATKKIPLRQSAPGKYSQRLNLAEEGAYYVNIQQEGKPDKTGESTVVETGFTIPYPAELGSSRDGMGLLRQIATITGGRTISQLAQLLGPEGKPPPEPIELWPHLLAAALLLWPLEIAFRRGILGNK